MSDIQLPKPARQGPWPGDPALYSESQMRTMYQQGYAAALSQTAGVAEGCGTECEKCGREAVHYLVMDNLPQQGRRMPFCEYCTREHEETAREVNDHEMRNFGGAYGLVAFHYEPLAAAPAASGGEVKPEPSPQQCRERLMREGKPYPRSGCVVCKTGGLTGCPYEKAVHAPNPLPAASVSERDA